MGSTQFFTSHGGSLLKTLLLECYTVYFFKTLKTIDSVNRVPNFLFSEFYLKLLLKFKTGPPLGLSCLMLSMFIIMGIIIRIIKTACFDNTK